ncbi:MAG: hypothetical protein ACXU86_21295, partial [Archangium sp.]
LEGKLDAWFREHKVDIAVLRPDRYIFGAVRGSHLAWLSAALRGWIRGPLHAVESPALESSVSTSTG